MPSPAPEALPIDPYLPEIAAAVAAEGRLVLCAETGAGKTTRVPPALLDVVEGKVLMLQPRRVAARAAAARIAEERGWRLGQEVGYQVRHERRSSDVTRLEVLTEGILTRRLQADPFLEGVSAVILDEFHERSLDADLALALLAEVRAEARPELAVVVMSATLDAEPLRRFLDDAPLVQVPGRSHPVQISYRPPPRGASRPPRLEERVVSALEEVCRREGGDVLVFLPGVGEIKRCQETIAEVKHGPLATLEVLPLHGALPLAEQQRALRPLPSGTGGTQTADEQRRVILATNVAETSLTLPGVDTVIDSGLVRQLRNDPGRGLDRLETVPCSMASAEQRAGRAGRLRPGSAIRLWSEAEQLSRPRQTAPEVRRVDLTRVVLELHAWGTTPERFGWFEAPERQALENARELLEGLGALHPERRAVTALGQAMLRLPLHPRLARLLLAVHSSCDDEARRYACAAAALLSEREILLDRGDAAQSGDSDLLLRLERLEEVEASKLRPSALRAAGVHGGAARAVLRSRDELHRRLTGVPRADDAPAAPSTRKGRAAGEVVEGACKETERWLRRLLLFAYPDRVGRRRGAGQPRGLLVGGRGVVLAPWSSVRDAELFLALAMDGHGADGRVGLASAIDASWLPRTRHRVLRWDESLARVIALEEERYGDLVLGERRTSAAPGDAEALLAEVARADLGSALDLEPYEAFRARAASLRRWRPEHELPACDDDALAALLPSLCVGKSSLAELRSVDLGPWLRGLYDHEQLQLLEREAPATIAVPSGRRAALTYREDGSAPICAVKLQELFGLRQTPRVAGGEVAVLLHLLAPNGRPVQVTQDLESFWRRTYAEVRKELRQRYPKHPWPEDPTGAEATHLTKKQLARRKS